MARKRRKLPTVSDQIRQAIRDSGLTNYRVAKLTGVEQSTLSRFMNGGYGVTSETLDILGDFLDLEVIRHGPKRS
ncbi:unnamed protein product [marine sediment metagenome]|uniref:HTH cro/C1-type domain-containing protein n=1 Tax=marine sediment metagenome TaxID=412755 RepID=X0V0U4_9ZZZZ